MQNHGKTSIDQISFILFLLPLCSSICFAAKLRIAFKIYTYTKIELLQILGHANLRGKNWFLLFK